MEAGYKNFRGKVVTDGDRLEILQTARANQEKDRPPYSMCVCLINAIMEWSLTNLTPSVRMQIDGIPLTELFYLFPEFKMMKPRHSHTTLFWWGRDDKQVRLDNFDKMIDFVKNRINEKNSKNKMARGKS